MPLPQPNFELEYPSSIHTDNRLQGLITPNAQSNESIGKIHCILAIVRIAEVILSLSEPCKKIFTFKLEALKELRDKIFHPERAENWEKIKSLLYSSNSQDLQEITYLLRLDFINAKS